MTAMGDVTSIAWTDRTYNAWVGCTKVGPGCDACYAEVRDVRFEGGIHWGPGAPRRRTSVQTRNAPYKWNREAEKLGRPLKVFAHSLSDVFDNEVPHAWRQDEFKVWAETPWLRWQVLTKRIGNAADMLADCPGWPLFNVGLVATVVDQAELERDAPKLRDTPCAWRGLSIEPQIGPIRLWSFDDDACALRGPCIEVDGGVTPGSANDPPEGYDNSYPWLDWVITGGESWQRGHEPRAYRLAWAGSLIEQCALVEVPLFVKQLGAWPVDDMGRRFISGDLKAGADTTTWPPDLVVRQFPDALLS